MIFGDVFTVYYSSVFCLEKRRGSVQNRKKLDSVMEDVAERID